jgi:hypothetical protein
MHSINQRKADAFIGPLTFNLAASEFLKIANFKTVRLPCTLQLINLPDDPVTCCQLILPSPVYVAVYRRGDSSNWRTCLLNEMMQESDFTMHAVACDEKFKWPSNVRKTR